MEGINVQKNTINNQDNIIKDVVVEVDEDGKRRDRVVIKTNLPQPSFPFKGTLNFVIDCPCKGGCKYVKDNFGIMPEVIFYSSLNSKLQTYRDIQQN
ncbi:hypothetical protein PBI_SCTP2_278 [Salicola phage SCTP-2]|nr:hypothetical protein PBI_SCTP2_278 [Salicola phage SCTP-2]